MKRIDVTATTTPYAAGTLDGRILAFDEVLLFARKLSNEAAVPATADPVI